MITKEELEQLEQLIKKEQGQLGQYQISEQSLGQRYMNELLLKLLKTDTKQQDTEQQDKQLDNNNMSEILKYLIILKALNGQLDDNIEQQIERAENIIQRLDKLSLKESLIRLKESSIEIYYILMVYPLISKVINQEDSISEETMMDIYNKLCALMEKMDEK